MNFESFEETVRFAIDREQEAVEFYEEAAAQEAYSGSRETFKSFADEERKHRAMLEDFLTGKRQTEAYQFEWIPDMKRSDYLVDLPYEKGMDYADMLRLAMKREEKSLALYNRLLKKTEKETLKNTFKMLCQEEAKHKLTLETLYDDYMAEMGD